MRAERRRSTKPIDEATRRRIVALCQQGLSIRAAAAAAGVSQESAYRISRGMGRQTVKERVTAQARDKTAAGEILTRAERHALWEEYRRREREAAG